MAKVISVVSEKGGVGKTATACHVGWAGSSLGMSVLVADVDTQGNASQRLSGDMSVTKRRKKGSDQLWLSDDVASYEYKNSLDPNIKILHGHKGLEALDKDDDLLPASVGMRDRIKSLPFDRVVFDTPPSIGLRVAAPLLWSDLALVVIEPSAEAIAGLGDTIDTIKDAQRQNRALRWRLILNCVRRSGKQLELVAQLSEVFKKELLAVFSRREPVADALGDHVAIWNYSGTRDKKLKDQWRTTMQSIVQMKV